MKKRILGLALAMLLLFCAAALGETNTQVKHYLMLGEDGYADQVTDDARTDTIVLVSLDTKYNRVILTSILRDSKINNPRGNETKINLLYKNHGFDGIVSCLERELEYLAIRSILLGKDPNMPDGPGLVHMTGRIALAYMRTRATGSGGDFARTERQRKVVAQLFDKCRSLSLLELVGLYNEVSSGMKMSLSAMDILSVLSQGYTLMTSGADFVEFRIPQDGTYSYGSVGSSSVLDVRWKTNKTRFHALLDNEQ